MPKLFARPALIVSVLLGAAVAAPASASAAGAPTLSNWDSAQQRQVVKDGLMSAPGGSFQGAAPLTAAQANAALAAVAVRLQAAGDQPGTAAGAQTVHTVRIGGGLVTVTRFDAMVVDQLGLADVAGARAVGGGLGRPAPAGLLRNRGGGALPGAALRPSSTEPTSSSCSRPTRSPGPRRRGRWPRWPPSASWNVDGARQSLAGFALPTMTADQRQALRIAVSRIGYPYVYAGESDTAEPASWMWGPQAHGGFDCSGFVWRVFKLSGLPWGNQIGGRTAAQMAGEIPRQPAAPDQPAASPATSCSSAPRISTAAPPSRTSSTPASTWATTG